MCPWLSSWASAHEHAPWAAPARNGVAWARDRASAGCTVLWHMVQVPALCLWARQFKLKDCITAAAGRCKIQLVGHVPRVVTDLELTRALVVYRYCVMCVQLCYVCTAGHALQAQLYPQHACLVTCTFLQCRQAANFRTPEGCLPCHAPPLCAPAVCWHRLYHIACVSDAVPYLPMLAADTVLVVRVLLVHELQRLASCTVLHAGTFSACSAVVQDWHQQWVHPTESCVASQ
jgi:hypothetical protein